MAVAFAVAVGRGVAVDVGLGRGVFVAVGRGSGVLVGVPVAVGDGAAVGGNGVGLAGELLETITTTSSGRLSAFSRA